MLENPENIVPQEDIPTPSPQAEKHSIFIGPYGLRAGWSLPIFFVITGVVTLPGVLTYEHYHPHARSRTVADNAPVRETPPSAVLGSHGTLLLGILVASWIMSRIERRNLRVFGLGGANRVSDCLKGLISGVVLLSLLVGVLHAMHLLVFTGYNVSGATAFLFGLKWFAAFCLVGLTEEYMFRGYLQYTLSRGLGGILPPGNAHRRLFGFWLAAILLSFVFFAGHGNNPGESPIGLLSVFLAGIMFAYSLWHTGSLWWAIGFHTTWDWAQSFLYGVGDSGTISQGRLFITHPAGNILYSGGLTGPEGSLFVLPILILAVLVVRFTVPKRSPPSLVPENWPPVPQGPGQILPVETV